MIKTDANKNSLKEIREREKQERDQELRQQCEAIAIERLGSEDELKKLSNKHNGIWYLPILDADGKVEKLLIMKPIDRHIISYASTKMESDGISAFLESAMRECTIAEHSDMVIIDEDDYFIPASQVFNKIMEGKKVALLKR